MIKFLFISTVPQSGKIEITELIKQEAIANNFDLHSDKLIGVFAWENQT